MHPVLRWPVGGEGGGERGRRRGREGEKEKASQLWALFKRNSVKDEHYLTDRETEIANLYTYTYTTHEHRHTHTSVCVYMIITMTTVARTSQTSKQTLGTT